VTTVADADFMGHPHGEWASLEGVPDEVALAFDLANSRDERVFSPHSRRSDRRDLVGTRAQLEAWLRFRLPEIGAVTDEDLDLVRRGREAVRLIAAANTDPARRDDARRAMRELSPELPLRFSVDEAGDISIEGAGSGVPRFVASALARAVAPSGREAWARLKMCSAPDCHWVFYDRSKPRTGRWCSMAVCGNRVKSREYRRRRPDKGCVTRRPTGAG
jgi:predicted RNA-binding Zn ribbon-like protein